MFALFCLLFSATAVDGRIVPKGAVTFEGTELTAEGLIAVGEVASLMKAHPDWKVTVRAHTDSQGSGAYNLKVSQDRAELVADVLIDQGVPRRHVDYEGLGETEPIASNGTDEGRQQNRRVEFVLR